MSARRADDPNDEARQLADATLDAIENAARQRRQRPLRRRWWHRWTRPNK